MCKHSTDRRTRQAYLGDCKLTCSCRAGQLQESCPASKPTGTLTASALRQALQKQIAGSQSQRATQVTSASLCLSWGHFYSFLFLIQFNRSHVLTKSSSPDNSIYLDIANELFTILRNGDLIHKIYPTFYIEIKAISNPGGPFAIIKSLHCGIFI